jgi:hypothetical protein
MEVEVKYQADVLLIFEFRVLIRRGRALHDHHRRRKNSIGRLTHRGNGARGYYDTYNNSYLQ